MAFWNRRRDVDPEIHRQMHAEPGGMSLADGERALVQKQWTGEATLCCKQFECRCGQNVRWINGQAVYVPGTTLPGSEYDRYLKNVRNAPDLRSAAMAVDQYVNKGRPTPPSPSLGKGYSLRDPQRYRTEAQRAEQNATETTMPLPRIEH